MKHITVLLLLMLAAGSYCFDLSLSAVLISRPGIASAPPVAAYFVGPGGSDGWPGTNAQPFATLGKAQTAMRSGAIKATYVKAGLISPGAPIVLTPADAGTLWRGDPANAAWNSAVIDGGGILEEIFSLQGSVVNVEFSHFKIQNVTYNGICGHAGAAFGPNTCTNSTVAGSLTGLYVHDMGCSNITVPSGARYADTGCVNLQGNVPSNTISNIVVTDSNGICIRASANGGTNDISNLIIRNSVFLRCMQQNSDGGAIYTQDYNFTSANIQITNNYIKDYGSVTGDNNRCFYGDAATSQVTFAGNICGTPGSFSVPASAAVILLCGQNNHITNNIFDLGPSGALITLQYGGCGAPALTSPMNGNTWSGNIIVGGFAGVQNINWAGYSGTASYVSGGAQSVYPTISSNTYWSYAGGTMNSVGRLVPNDTSPTTANPLCTTYEYRIGIGSPAYSHGYTDPPRGWGPAGYTIPTSGGAAPSCPLS